MNLFEITAFLKARSPLFAGVLVRVDPNFRLAMHSDTDEANAASIGTGAVGKALDSCTRG